MELRRTKGDEDFFQKVTKQANPSTHSIYFPAAKTQQRTVVTASTLLL